MAVCWASCCAVSSATHCGVGISRNTRNKQSRAKLQLVLAEKPLQKLVDNIRFVVQRHNGAYMSYCIFLMCCLRLGSQNVLLPQLRRSLKLLHLMNVVSAASVLTASARGRLPWNRPLPAETISPQCFMYTLLGYGKALAKLRPTNSKGAAAPPGSVSVAPPTQPNTSIRTRSFAPPGYSCSHWPLGHFVTFLYLELARESFRPGQ